MIEQHLQIGDWVLHDQIAKHVMMEWHNNEVSLCAPGQTWGSIYADKLPKADCEGIRLTQELLYKNTYDEASNKYWVYNAGNYIQYCLSDTFVVKCFIDGEKEVFKYEGLKLEYVHELQHLLEIAHVNRDIVL